MPQQSLLPDYPPMTSMSITVKSYPHTKFADEVSVAVMVSVGSSPLKTRYVGSLRGLECDFLDTLVTEVTSAYMYGERTKDVATAAVSVVKQARAHAIAHQP